MVKRVPLYSTPRLPYLYTDAQGSPWMRYYLRLKSADRRPPPEFNKKCVCCGFEHITGFLSVAVEEGVVVKRTLCNLCGQPFLVKKEQPWLAKS